MPPKMPTFSTEIALEVTDEPDAPVTSHEELAIGKISNRLAGNAFGPLEAACTYMQALMAAANQKNGAPPPVNLDKGPGHEKVLPIKGAFDLLRSMGYVRAPTFEMAHIGINCRVVSKKIQLASTKVTVEWIVASKTSSSALIKIVKVGLGVGDEVHLQDGSKFKNPPSVTGWNFVPLKDVDAFKRKIPYAQRAMQSAMDIAYEETQASEFEFEDVGNFSNGRQFTAGAAHEIVHGLWLGSVGSVLDMKSIQRYGITHVLSCDKRAGAIMFQQAKAIGFKFLLLDLDNRDAEHTLNMAVLDKALTFTRAALDSRGSVLVYGIDGANLSAAVVISYLIDSGKTYAQAEALVRKLRPIVKPSRQMCAQLGGATVPLGKNGQAAKENALVANMHKRKKDRDLRKEQETMKKEKSDAKVAYREASAKQMAINLAGSTHATSPGIIALVIFLRILSVANLGTDIAVLAAVWHPTLKPEYLKSLGVNASNVTASYQPQKPAPLPCAYNCDEEDEDGTASGTGSGTGSSALLLDDTFGIFSENTAQSDIFGKSSRQGSASFQNEPQYHTALFTSPPPQPVIAVPLIELLNAENELLNASNVTDSTGSTGSTGSTASPTGDSSTPASSQPASSTPTVALANRSARGFYNASKAAPNASFVPPFVDNFATIWEVDTWRTTTLTMLFIPHMIVFLHMSQVWYNERMDAARKSETVLMVYMFMWLIVGPILILVVELMLCTFLIFIPDFDFISLWFPGFVAFYADARPMSEAIGACIPQLCLCFVLYARTEMVDNIILIPFPLFLVSMTLSILCLMKSSYFVLHSRYGGASAYWNEVTSAAESEADNVPLLDDIINGRIVEVNYTGHSHLSYRDWKAVGRGLGFSKTTESFIAQNCRLESRLCKTLCQGFAKCIHLRCIDLAHNDITNSGCAAVCQLLQRGLMLKQLSLANNLISTKGVRSLRDAFKMNNSVQYLDLRSNCIGPDGERMLRLFKVTFVTFTDQYPFLTRDQLTGKDNDDQDSDSYHKNNRGRGF